MKIAFYLNKPVNKLREGKSIVQLLYEAIKRGNETYYCQIGDITLKENEVVAKMKRLGLRNYRNREEANKLVVSEEKEMPLKEMDALIVRMQTQFPRKQANVLLDLIKDKLYILDKPESIMKARNKWNISLFKNYVPQTYLCDRIETLEKAFKELNKEMVVKPLIMGRGKDVLHITNFSSSKEELKRVLEKYKEVIAQQYLAESKDGDRRILFLGNECIGSFRRIPRDDWRANISLGAFVSEYWPKDRDIEICKKVAEEFDLDFFGADLIGDYLIEINTSAGWTNLVKSCQGIASKILIFVEREARNFKNFHSRV